MKKATLPYKVYTLPPIILSGTGLLASIYLAISHYRNYTDIGYASFCAISKAINCDTVSQSPWSLFFNLPLPIWGISAYAVFFLITLPAQKDNERSKYLWDLLFILSLLFTGADLYFAYITTLKIKAYCLVCLLTYAISLGLLFNTWIIRRRFVQSPLFQGLKQSISVIACSKTTRYTLLFVILGTTVLKIMLPHYWIYHYPLPAEEVQNGFTPEGRPWIGAENPSVIINEFTDYQCFQCSKMHLILRSLVNKHPKSLRLVHYHYPMDHEFNNVLVKKPFHTGSGNLALLAIAAGLQGKYWQTNDALYSIAKQELKVFNIRKFASKMDLDEKQLKLDMYSKDTLKELEADIRTGLKNQIIGTPSFIVNGHMYPGNLPPSILERLGQ